MATSPSERGLASMLQRIQQLATGSKITNGRERQYDLPPPGGPYASNFLEHDWADDKSEVWIILRLWAHPVPDPPGYPSTYYELTWHIRVTNEDARSAIEAMIANKLDGHRLLFWFDPDPGSPSGLSIAKSEWDD